MSTASVGAAVGRHVGVGMTRDSLIWWVGIIGAVLAYLSSSEAPSLWHYDDWIKAIAFVVSTVSAKLATSPLPGAKES